MNDEDFFKKLAIAMVQSGQIKLSPMNLSDGVEISPDTIDDFYNRASKILVLAELAYQKLEQDIEDSKPVVLQNSSKLNH